MKSNRNTESAFFSIRTWLWPSPIEHDPDIYCRNYSRKRCFAAARKWGIRTTYAQCTQSARMQPKKKLRTKSVYIYKSRNFKFVTKLTNLNSQKPTNNENGVKFKAFFCAVLILMILRLFSFKWFNEESSTGRRKRMDEWYSSTAPCTDLTWVCVCMFECDQRTCSINRKRGSCA